MATPLYRVYEGGRLEAATVYVPRVQSVESLAARLHKLSKDIGSIACTAEMRMDSGATLEFVNYPRAKYRDRESGAIQHLAHQVAEGLRGYVEPPIQPRKISDLPLGTLVMGRRRGYSGEDIPAQSIIRTIAARSKPSNPSKPTVHSKDVQVLSVSEDYVYSEPALELRYTSKIDLPMLAQVAYEYEQERFSLVLPRQKRVYMIETEHCQDPDSSLPSVQLTKTRLLDRMHRQNVALSSEVLAQDD